MTYSMYQLDKICYPAAPLEFMTETRFLIKKYFKQKKTHHSKINTFLALPRI